MNVQIFSRQAILEIMKNEFPKNCAVISFFSPRKNRVPEEVRVDYSGVCDRVFYVSIHDIDREVLPSYGLTYDTYFTEADALASFIYQVKNDGLDLICQCDYGQSRSAACAAAILQHFEKRGIDVFVDYRYYPNQMVYHKVFDALNKYKEKNS